jgi:hypothetical protein
MQTRNPYVTKKSIFELIMVEMERRKSRARKYNVQDVIGVVNKKRRERKGRYRKQNKDEKKSGI